MTMIKMHSSRGEERVNVLYYSDDVHRALTSERKDIIIQEDGLAYLNSFDVNLTIHFIHVMLSMQGYLSWQ